MQKARLFPEDFRIPKEYLSSYNFVLYFKSMPDYYSTCYLTVIKSILTDINLFGSASELS